VLAGYGSSTGKPGQVGVGPVEGVGTRDADLDGTDGDDNGTLVNGVVRSLPVTTGDGGTEERAVDFGFFQSSGISGRVFVDGNGNGQIDSQDTSGLGNVRIRAAGPAGMFTTTTDANGNYQFGNLPAGNYTVTQLPQPAGYRSSTPNLVSTVLTSAQSKTVNFGEVKSLDLKVRQSASRTVAPVGGFIDLTYRIKNLGTLDATHVSLIAPLPAGLKFVSVQANGATYDSATQSASIATLAAGAETVIKVRVQVKQLGSYRLRATVQADQREDNLGNNQAIATVVAPGFAFASAKTIGSNWLLGSKYR